MSGAGLLALSTLDTFICSYPMAFCYAPRITFLFYLFVAAAEYLFFIVKLHIKRYWNILGRVVTVSATGTSRIHIISYFFLILSKSLSLKGIALSATQQGISICSRVVKPFGRSGHRDK